mmetsp:Transcript_17066/g.30998  ORF Transcript_17066/g.30998 Transcript_17066/m.30998 type:complete len:366 (+) Transcript_17066:69-1166(+)|eukprot:CAMPEP_0201944154 /NCGR_PEP_ID=MMETSP0903-20130614/52583_1 /ASSEMBLY_ACC=CAM_ASM_000552 /TAXON_ID=420261 /ORGANISM="Thalassiosira antarctica, Strain CCMP982" /LENGTH=365 /DNA_ID=CAMNT_0048487071 /DNA_START=42 /DNA_END=1139 /DNA_ORIENTATION=-
MSETSPPPTKKRKSEGGSSSETSLWRTKSIERFSLQPVPTGWKASVAVGSEEAWKRYYNYRVDKEKNDPRVEESDSDNYDSDGNSIPGDDDDDEGDWEKEGLKSVLFSWAEYGIMDESEKTMMEGCQWQWTPQSPTLQWEEEGKLRSADYYAHVWSPFAIPHAIKLSHSWYGKVGWDSYDLVTDWSYLLLDFEEDIEHSKKTYVELCSNNYDVIKTSHLNKTTCGKLRKFLYGANSKESKKVTCSDKDFLLLLFGSMGSTDKDLMEDAKDCSLGYSWCPWKEEGMNQKLFDAKAPADDDPNGEPPTALKGYNPRWCSWLRYRILEVSDSVGPISKHYKPPPAKKASGRDDDSRGGGYGSGEGGDY